MRRALFVLIPLIIVALAVADPATLPELLAMLGPFAPFGLLAAFALGSLVAFPGLALVGLAMVGFGSTGPVLALSGATLYVVTPFVFTRWVGGTSGPPGRWTRRVLRHVEAHPIAVVAALRLVGHLSAPLSVALCLTGMRFRDYAIGSALGLFLPLGVLLFTLSSPSAEFAVTATPTPGVCAEEPPGSFVASTDPGP
jgi:uncharacterized membrane protein YdjX (TVP38/TMEM64 family)